MARRTRGRRLYRVYSVTASGAGGYTSMWPMTMADARKVAAGERAKTYNIKVRIERETDPTLLRIANG